jgi:N-sulfoglucosamine sulfohydrolase
MIVADDLNYDSTGLTGCAIEGITPNIDRLAAEGVHFLNGHVTIAACQPSRQCWMTGRYPHNIGALGFEPIDVAIPTLQESLRAAGYRNGILSKVQHLEPEEKYCWDTVVKRGQLGHGRNPMLYYRHSRRFFEEARQAGQPFFLMANSNDPHRPFTGSPNELAYVKRMGGGPLPEATRVFDPDQIQIPGFLPDIPDVRKEVAEYYGSTFRCDQMVGEVLRALAESGLEDSTMVIFLSDNGMSFPFAKTNVYFSSTRTVWIVRWPGMVKPGHEDREHFISGTDLMPTILEAAGLAPVAGVDGRSFLPLLMGNKQKGREQVFTVCYKTASGHLFPMRCIQDQDFGYIYNGWSDQKTVFHNEGLNGMSFKAMQRAAKENLQIAQRVKLLRFRVVDELFHFGRDPDALENLVDDPRYWDTLARMRKAMADVMEQTGDPLLGSFRNHLEGV